GCVRTIDGVTWALLIDGLGHGPKAAEVAERAVDELGLLAAESVEAGLARLHARLEGTRGAAATLLRFAERPLGLCGVGNVPLRTLAGAQVPYIPANGILGHRRLRPRCGEIELSGPGRLLLFTDGIVPTAPLSSLVSLDDDALCLALLTEHSLARDDATVVALRYWV